MITHPMGLVVFGYERCKLRDLTEHVQEVCKTYRCTKEELFSRSRYEPLPTARAALAVAFRGLGFSLPEIGRLLRRDHTSVMAMLKRARPSGVVLVAAPVVEEKVAS